MRQSRVVADSHPSDAAETGEGRDLGEQGIFFDEEQVDGLELLKAVDLDQGIVFAQVEVADDDEYSKALLCELQILKNLRHPRVVPHVVQSHTRI